MPVKTLAEGSSIQALTGAQAPITFAVPAVPFGSDQQTAMTIRGGVDEDADTLKKLDDKKADRLGDQTITGAWTFEQPMKTYYRSKTKVLDWKDKSILWLGTSIPANGGTSSYPDLVAARLEATCLNNAWPGSYATFNKDRDPYTGGSMRALSMTEDDRLAAIAEYGTPSIYDDSYGVSSASYMTADYRIYQPFGTTGYDAVIIDHNHNNRFAELGTLTPPEYAITGVTKGTDTVLTLADATGVEVGDAVALRVTGIDKLDYHAGRVQAVSGDQITLNVDSSGYSGTFVSGTAAKLDRATIAGATQFLYYYTLWAAVSQGHAAPEVILCGAPSRYTHNELTPSIVDVNENLRLFAEHWDLAYFDPEAAMRITAEEHLTFFPDTVHPTTLEARRAIAAYWVEWMLGGATPISNERDYIARGGLEPYTDQREALYSRFTGGFSTPQFIVTGSAPVLDEDFSGDLSAYTLTGAVPPAIVDAPWGGGEKAIVCTVDADQAGGDDSFIERTLSFPGTAGMVAEFDLWLDETVGLVDEGTALPVPFFRVTNAGGAEYTSLELVVRAESVGFRASVWDVPPQTRENFQPGYQLDKQTKYRIKIEHIRGTADYTGALAISVDDEVIASYAVDDLDQPGWGGFTAGPVNATSYIIDGTLHLGNIEIGDISVADYTGRLSGSHGGAKFVNGIATEAAPESIVGTVSQTGGVPDGAIIERGSNANGSYVRYADGTQICWHKLNLGSVTANGAGTYTDPYRTSGINWTFPATFEASETPVVTGQAESSGGLARAMAIYHTATGSNIASTIGAVRLSSDATATTVTANLMATGRWF